MTKHFVSASCEGETCRYARCGQPATHKVGEEIPFDYYPAPDITHVPCRHNFTAYVCCDHFFDLFGSAVPCAMFERTRRPRQSGMEQKHEAWVLAILNWLHGNNIPAKDLEIPARLTLVDMLIGDLRVANNRLIDDKSRLLAERITIKRALDHVVDAHESLALDSPEDRETLKLALRLATDGHVLQ